MIQCILFSVVKSSDVFGESSLVSSYLIPDLPSMEYAHNLTEPKMAGLAQAVSALALGVRQPGVQAVL